MKTLTTDLFIEAFAALLVERGHRHVRLNDPAIRDQLHRVWRFFDREVDAFDGDDARRRRALVNLRNLFRPSPIGSFDDFEALLREKQVYLTEHPNPFYQDISIKVPATSTDAILGCLDSSARDLVGRAVETYVEG